ncbi:MAG: magnesium transporter CorA family protein [Chloroflexota bacterium]
MPELPISRARLPRPVRLRSTRAPAQPPVSPVPRRDVVLADGLRWIHIPRPTGADGEWLQAEFGFHALDLEDVFSRNQRPKLDRYEDYLFLVMQFPVYEKTRQRMVSVELDLFEGKDYLITLPSAELPPLEALFERVGERDDLREQIFSKGAGYLLYRIVDACVDASFPMLRKMGLKLDQLEDDIFEERRSAEIVRDINDLKQEIITFRRIVRPQRTVLGDLEKTKQRYLAEDMEIYFDDISDAAERIWDILENYKEVIESLETTNESMLSHRLNDAIKVLNAVSVLVLPATLIASIWGMNVWLPLIGSTGNPANFWLLVVIMLLTIIGSFWYFRRRGWL